MTLLIVSFIAGILTILAPCILPLLPVILGGAVADGGNKRRPFVIIGALSISVFAFTLLLKGSTALISVSPTFWSYVSAIILAAFGLTLLFPETWARIVLKIPGHNKPDRWITRGYGQPHSFWTDVLVGAALGPVFTTCSPTFFVILATVLPQSLGMGLIDLAAYIIGLALALLLISWIGQKLIGKLEWAINPYGWFKKTLGVLFIILAVLIAIGSDKKIETSILNSGFFDVTNIEQKIHQALEAPKTFDTESNSNNSATSSDSGVNSNTASSTSTPKTQPRGNYVDIVKPAGFVNSAPFKLADIVGKKVILIDFIDYTCINCQRTFPYLNDWYKKYKDQGLEIVAIHTPEFSFEKDIANVKIAAEQFGLKFPIVLDNDYATWNAYGNQYWPHKYLIDIHGNVVYDHIGEGNDAVTEQKIVDALNGRKKFLGEAGTVTVGNVMPEYDVSAESPETYFGALRNAYIGNGSPEYVGKKTYAIPDQLSANRYYLGGTWNTTEEYAETATSSDQLSYTFTATNMYLIAVSPDGSEMTAQVLIDGRPIPKEWAGKDIGDNGILKIQQSRLYHLYSNPSIQRHRIDIIFQKPGVRVYTFTFG